jgi:hypothetical protein
MDTTPLLDPHPPGNAPSTAPRRLMSICGTDPFAGSQELRLNILDVDGGRNCPSPKYGEWPMSCLSRSALRESSPGAPTREESWQDWTSVAGSFTSTRPQSWSWIVSGPVLLSNAWRAKPAALAAATLWAFGFRGRIVRRHASRSPVGPSVPASARPRMHRARVNHLAGAPLSELPCDYRVARGVVSSFRPRLFRLRRDPFGVAIEAIQVRR